MSIFSSIYTMIRQVLGRVIPYQNIQQVENIDTPLSQEMQIALEAWHRAYLDKPNYKGKQVKTLNIPAFIASEISRQVTLEFKWSITAGKDDSTGEDITNPRSEFLSKEFEKLATQLRSKTEIGCAAGGMTIKPYVRDGHIYFDYTPDWDLYPIAFGDDSDLSDVVFRDMFSEGKIYYSRLERHTVEGDRIKITQRAFKSSSRDALGKEIPLTEVPQWKDLKPVVYVNNVDGQLFGWFRVASANTVDPLSPMGVAVFAKSMDTIKEADTQYSRLLWEFEGGEMAIDVDPMALRPIDGVMRNGAKAMETPKLNERLFRAVDLGTDETYHVFAPTLRDSSLVAGLNQILMKIEDQSGLARGTLSDANTEARTATELTILRNRTYTTIADNQQALERALREVVRAMDKYADLYNLAPAGEYEVSFDWDDSVIADTETQLQQRLLMLNNGMMSKIEMRMWFFGETRAQAEKALQEVQQEKVSEMQAAMAIQQPNPDQSDVTVPPDDGGGTDQDGINPATPFGSGPGEE